MSWGGRLITGVGERSPVGRTLAFALALAFASAFALAGAVGLGPVFVRLTGRSMDDVTGAGAGGGGEDVRVTTARSGVVGAGGVSAATGGSGVGLMLPARRVDVASVVGDCAVVVPLVVVVAAARGM